MGIGTRRCLQVGLVLGLELGRVRELGLARELGPGLEVVLGLGLGLGLAAEVQGEAG